jgi:hypothetical protein
MLKIEIKKEFSPVLEEKDFLSRRLEKILDDASEIIVRDYKYESPVDSGVLRQNVRARKTGKLEYTVTTRAIANGYNYAELVYHGTMDWRGSSADIGRINRVRTNYVNRSGRRGIKPNKYADRAKESAEPKVIRFIRRELTK